ncbi:anti-sigma-D factor RsdA [Williamsia sp. 1135]|uniref:anti-sigma-D factor RsdA n=1 Tax=Williamsia sp. 1135 TaxID=1889262 RepID=UPI0014388341|nr:anti-sigma-D factor RsdA [Williamsia sp. 1135]
MAESESPEEIEASDEFLNALACGLAPTVRGRGEAALADLLAQWRQRVLDG